ncbi:MAG: acyl-CoA dehydrogenase family protein [Rhodospirillaceae bacterium]|nr:acyl-CoA dehydrogenase family protein [Rhodospirillaceae bacterium]
MTRFLLQPPDLPPALEPLRRDVRAFIARARDAGWFTPRCHGWMAFDADFSKRLGAAGYIGMTFPKAWGGHGRSFFERYVVNEEMLAAGAPVGFHWIADRQSGPQIIKHGTDELRKKVIPGIVRGEICFAIGMSEPDAGSDLAGIRSKATKVDGGWKLEGRKVWTTNGHRAHYMIALFRTAPLDEKKRHAGMTQFVVDLSSPGITRRPIRDMSGGEDFSESTYDDVFVPDSHVLGQAGEGWALVTGELAYERSGPERFLSNLPLLAAAVPGLAQQDGDAVRYETGRLMARLSILRQMSLAVAGKLEAGEQPNVEAALVKDMGNALEQQMPGILRRIDQRRPDLGVEGYESLLAEALLQAPSITLRGGTPEILRGIIARGLGLR